MERVRRLGTETDAALSALPEGTIVVYSDGGYQQAADPEDDRAGFGWSAHRNPKGPTASVGEMVEYGFAPVTVDATDMAIRDIGESQ